MRPAALAQAVRPTHRVSRGVADNGGVAGCILCERNSDLPTLPDWDRVFVTDAWRVAHAWSALPGWLLLVPRRHVRALDELNEREAAELGPLLAAVTAALREVVACQKTFVMLFAEREGFEHIHLHIVPRMPDFTLEHRGPGVFELLHRPEHEWVPVDERNALAVTLGRAMSARFANPS